MTTWKRAGGGADAVLTETVRKKTEYDIKGRALRYLEDSWRHGAVWDADLTATIELDVENHIERTGIAYDSSTGLMGGVS